MPESAQPWDSGFLVNPGDRFEVVLPVEGVHDYFCPPHAAGSMVGRIIVGRPGGPGTGPVDYFTAQPGTQDRLSEPDAARRSFPAIDVIRRQRVVRHPGPF
jgi:hypothetical protein